MNKTSIFLLVGLAIVIFFLVKPSKKNESKVVHELLLQQVEEIGRLELVRYNIQDIVEYEKMRNWLPNSRTILMVSGEVVACIDLALLTEDDITVEGDSVALLLPIPEICHVKIDHSRSKVYDVKFGLWDTPDLVDEAYREAEKEIHNKALEMGLVSQSRDSAVKLLTPILQALGFEKITINFRFTPLPEQNGRIDISPR
jgi:hypothetical protein